MDNKKIKINIIFIIIVILLIVTALMIRFEFNPISYFVGGNDDEEEKVEVAINYNGVYRYRESLKDSYKLFNNCTLSYQDYYIVILNSHYYRYKSSCVGTFLLDQGKARDLKIEKTLENNLYILFDEKQYLRTDLVSEVVVGNYYYNNLRKNSKLQAETYHILMKESQIPGRYFNITKASFSAGHGSYSYTMDVSKDNKFTIQLLRGKYNVYKYTVDNLEKLPLFRTFGDSISVIELIKSGEKYNYTLKVYQQTKLIYNLADKFPITVDGDTLNFTDNVYIKYSVSDNAFVVLVSKSNKLCETNSDSTDIAYYEFHVKYNYVDKNFDNPKYIRKVYKNEGCKYVNDLMED